MEQLLNLSAYPSLIEILKESVKKYPHKPAFSHFNHIVTYAQFDALTDKIAGQLQALGLMPGQRLVLMLPNCLQYPIFLFAGFKAGLVIVNINPLYTARELLELLKGSQASAIVVLSHFIKTVESATQHYPIKHIISTHLGDLFPTIKRFSLYFYLKYVKRSLPKTKLKSVIEFHKWITTDSFKQYTPVKLAQKDIAFLQYTGGTTGLPKAAILTHGNMIANIFQVNAWFANTLLYGQETVITGLPLYHVFALLANCLFFMRLGGCNVLITDPKNTKQFIRILKKTDFTAITGVNTLFHQLVSQTGFEKVNFSELKLALGGGMAVEKRVSDKWEAITGQPILQAYGLTECAPAVCINPYGTPFNGSIGCALPETELVIRDADNQDCKIGELGELCVKGPQVMQGYWKNLEATQLGFTPDSYFKTGDIVRVDTQGFYYLVDRKKEIILISGFNVFPQEVESVIYALEGVLEVAVVGILNSKNQETVCAFVVKKDPNLRKKDIQRVCRENLAPYKRPKKIEFRDHLPKSAVGKILKRALKESS